MAARSTSDDGGGGEPLRLDDDIADCWPLWRLWIEGKVTMSEFDHISIDTLEAGNRALDAWRAAEVRAHRKMSDKIRGGKR